MNGIDVSHFHQVGAPGFMMEVMLMMNILLWMMAQTMTTTSSTSLCFPLFCIVTGRMKGRSSQLGAKKNLLPLILNIELFYHVALRDASTLDNAY
jgi:hypothetical protein